jgi:DNA-binding NtrC family response regulator
VILADGDIHARHLNLSFHAPLQAAEVVNAWTGFDFSGSLTDVSRRAQGEAEKRKIEQTLKEAGGNKGRASELLGVSYKTLLMKLKDYGIE